MKRMAMNSLSTALKQIKELTSGHQVVDQGEENILPMSSPSLPSYKIVHNILLKDTSKAHLNIYS